MNVIVLSGLPGSGKSTYAKQFLSQHRAAVVSADDYFFRSDGTWAFDPTGLPAAHADCLRRFLQYCQDSSAYNVDVVVVDNTNLTSVEIAPYMAIAQAYGHEARVVTLPCAPSVAFQRQTHGVPLDRFMHMFANLRERSLPPWWISEVAREEAA